MTQGNRQTRSTHTLLWVLCVLILTTELFVFTWARVQCTATSYAIHREQEEHKSLLSLEKKLRIERAHLLSPDRIASIATGTMDLQMPEQDQIITIR